MLAADEVRSPSRLRRIADDWLIHGYALRNRLVMSPRFQNTIAKWPITRQIARFQARAAFDLVAGFVYSQVLLACVQLRLFEHLKDGPRTLDDIARLVDLPPDGARRLLEAAQALGLVSQFGGRGFGLALKGAAIAGNGAVQRMIEHHALVYVDLADPVALLRGTRQTALSTYWAYGGDNPAQLQNEQVASYTRLMAGSQSLVAGQALDSYDFSRHARILDIGGGDGTFLTRVAERAPLSDLVLFDLPAVAQSAAQTFKKFGLAGRAAAIGGDFKIDELPRGADLITLVRIVHDHNDDVVVNLFRKVRLALAPGGTLLIVEPMSRASRPEPATDVYFNFYFMAMGRGRARSVENLSAMLRAAGFTSVSELPTSLPLQARVLSAQINAKTVKTT
ncbi:MAG: methyltransferase [Hyphomicrobium sp.]